MKELDPFPELLQGFADSRHWGTRWGPVHLFSSGGDFLKSIPLCGRRLKRWNFEGHTETDFCKACERIARAMRPTDKEGAKKPGSGHS